MHLRLQTIFDGYTLAIPDTSGKPTVSARFSSAVNPTARANEGRVWLAKTRLSAAELGRSQTSACFSGSSMPCRCSPSSGRREPPISTFLPPIEDVALAIQYVGFLHSSSATHSPKPPSSAPQTPMGDTPMHLLHFGRRPTAYVNFEWPPAHGAEGSANSQTASGF